MDYKEKVIAMLNSKELSQEQKEKLENIFPELKENEDERIRKDIISYLQNEKIVKRYISDIEVDKWIAWLEKQGQTFTKKDVDDAYLKGVCDAKHEIEKQGKPLDANKVIGWMDEHVPTKFEDMQNYVNQFKKDFEI